jgi:formylglycine-generating enzyme required for sulfatase activity
LTSLGKNAQGYEEYRNNKDGSVLILVPAGSFTMGGDARRAEYPPHRVRLSYHLIGKYTVTNRQFAEFVVATGYKATGNWQSYARDWGANCPVVMVSWRDAVAYSAWAGARLPTEAEWEYAARGPQSLTYPWGNTWDAERVWWGGNNGGRAQAVGTKPEGASPCGAYDMEGNVYQWCSSKFKAYPYNEADGRETLEGSNYRVVRGAGGPQVNPKTSSSAGRCAGVPDAHHNALGFRIARTP